MPGSPVAPGRWEIRIRRMKISFVKCARAVDAFVRAYFMICPGSAAVFAAGSFSRRRRRSCGDVPRGRRCQKDTPPTTKRERKTQEKKKQEECFPKFFRRADRSSASGRAPSQQPTNP